jgi:hypothetical protein
MKAKNTNPLLSKEGCMAEFELASACRISGFVQACLKIVGILCLLGAFSLKAWSMMDCVNYMPQLEMNYEKVHAVALLRGRGRNGEIEVLRSWKMQLPKNIIIFKDPFKDMPERYLIKDRRTHILFLYRVKEIKDAFRVAPCAGNDGFFREKDNEIIKWLDRRTSCGCSQDEKTPYHRADAIVYAKVLQRITKNRQEFARIEVLKSWKSKMPKTFIVQTVDHRRKCGYPIQEGHSYLLHLKQSQTELSTNICSGNLVGFVPSSLFYLYDNLDHRQSR